jgi:hypothetical protein
MADVKIPETDVVPTPVEESTPVSADEVEGKKTKKNSLPIFIAILSTLVLCVVALIVYLQFFNDRNEVIDDTEDSNLESVEESTDGDTTDSEVCLPGEEECDTDISTEYDKFDGKVLSSTKIPTGWRVIEKMDGAGTEYLLEGETYTGLTGLEIVNPNNKRVFSMMAVTGIGFAGCSEYVEFADDNPSYRSQMESNATEMGDTLNVTDYTNTDYEEFEFLGTTVRRIGDKYFHDTQEGNNYFEAPCVAGLITLEGLTYTDGSGYQLEAYFYGAEDTATSGDLLIVDQILGSLELVK